MQCQWGVQGACPSPPFRVKNEKNSEGRKASRASKTKPPLPLGSRSETATEYAYKHYFFMASNLSSMIKQLLKLTWLSQNVVFVSVLHIIMETIILCTTTWGHEKLFSIPCTNYFSLAWWLQHAFSPMWGMVEKMCWAKVKHSHSNTAASISFRVNCIVESILPNLPLLPPRCNRYCLRNSFDFFIW